MMNKSYPISKKLDENPSRHCATLAITVSPGHPNEKSRNGTLTFVKTEGKTFGITCWHVIEIFRKLSQESLVEFSPSLYTMTPKPCILNDRFIRPTSNTEYHQLDIAICKIKSDFIQALGKEPIDLDNQVVQEKIEFGYAVGFPEQLKYIKDSSNPNTMIISLPTVSILAEIHNPLDAKVKLFSVFEKPQGYDTYSGMSGGPIFWSTKDTYGIFGITCAANTGNFAGKGKSIILEGELAKPEIIKHWINQVDEMLED